MQKGWATMQKMDNKNDNYYDFLLLRIDAMPIDEQIVHLCRTGKAYVIPLDVLASQYKYALTHNVDSEKRNCLAEALDTICPNLKHEMEGLYVS